MLFAISVTAIVILALLWEVAAPRLERAVQRRRANRRRPPPSGYDPGRERRAEQRARALLRSCVNQAEWAMYRDLGFIRVWGQGAARASSRRRSQPDRDAPYAYLIYPHKPIVAYVPQTGRLLNEYCVEFPDESRPHGSSLLPESDDVLAKWMALTGDEERLLAQANLHMPGRQIDPRQVQRDLWRLRQWERERERAARRAQRRGQVTTG